MEAPAPRPQFDVRRLLLLWGVSVPLVALSALAVLLGWLGFIGFAPGCDGGACPQPRSTPVVFATLALACIVVWVVATAVVLGCIRSAPERIGWFVCIYLGLANGSLAAVPVAYLLWMALWAAGVRAVVHGAADPV